MRSLATSTGLAFLLAASLSSASARATEPHPDAGIAFAVGAATIFAGFAIGATLTAASGDDSAKTEAGWLTIETGFALAPLTSHAVVGEWGRGAFFAALPAATTLGTLPVFAENQAAVDHGTLAQQRVMWAFFVAGLGGAVIGVIDVAFAPGRALRVAPSVGPHDAGLVFGGVL